MERRNLALLCAGVVCFWLFALAFGTAQGRGLRIQPAVQTQAEPAAQTLTVTPPQLTLPCRAAILIDQTSGAVLYEMNADQTPPCRLVSTPTTWAAVRSGWSPGSSSRWTRCSRPSVCPLPTMQQWRWPSLWAAASLPLCSR